MKLPAWSRAPSRMDGLGASIDENNLFGKIMGGEAADPGNFPWQAALSYRGTGVFCGGTIVSLNTVITATHCLLKENKEKLSVSAGHVSSTIK